MKHETGTRKVHCTHLRSCHFCNNPVSSSLVRSIASWKLPFLEYLSKSSTAIPFSRFRSVRYLREEILRPRPRQCPACLKWTTQVRPLFCLPNPTSAQYLSLGKCKYESWSLSVVPQKLLCVNDYTMRRRERLGLDCLVTKLLRSLASVGRHVGFLWERIGVTYFGRVCKTSKNGEAIDTHYQEWEIYEPHWSSP